MDDPYGTCGESMNEKKTIHTYTTLSPTLIAHSDHKERSIINNNFFFDLPKEKINLEVGEIEAVTWPYQNGQ